MITGLAHACFTVANLEAALHFYRDGLGLKEAFDFKDDDGRRFGVYLYLGGRNFIELFEGQLDARADKQSFKHICLEVDDIEPPSRPTSARGIEVGR